jgi:hypothetical protein
LISDLGGQAGLWLGVSIVAFFELIELIIDISILITKQIRRKLRNKQDVQPTPAGVDGPFVLDNCKQELWNKSITSHVTGRDNSQITAIKTAQVEFVDYY